MEKIKLAIVASSGSGKSTAATMMQEIFQEMGVNSAVHNLAKPLYDLQSAYYSVIGENVRADQQNQKLLEQIAVQLRSISKTCLVDDLFRRLEQEQAPIVITADLRDSQVDWPLLVSRGYRCVRISCEESTRRQRMLQRNDLQSVVVSDLDEDIKRIKADYTINNNGSLAQLKQRLSELIDNEICDRREAHVG